MKNIVFFGYNMDMGGAERALVNVINLIHGRCNITLILLEKKGVLLKEIPADVKVIEIKTNIVKYAVFRFFAPFRKRIIRNLTNGTDYAVAVAFMEGRAATFLADMNQPCEKIAWIHNDVNVFDIGIKEREILKSYRQMDKIIAVSIQSQHSFCKKYGFDESKVSVVYNLIDEADILKKAAAEDIKTDVFTFVNVARMRPQKRHDRLINVANRLIKDGFTFKLWLIGGGPLQNEVETLIKSYHIENYVESLGMLENPFPYVKAADYFVMSSDHEGYPLSLLESLLLKTKVISTDVSGAREILGNDEYGYVVAIDEDALYEKMKEVLMKPDVHQIDANLAAYKGSNALIKQQLLALFQLL